MSTVCKKLAEASTLVPLFLIAAFQGALPSGLFSHLVMSWAHNVHTLAMDSRILAVSGHADFLARASRLHTVIVRCRNASASAELDSLLSTCPDLGRMECCGHYMPRTFPPALQTLRVDARSWRSDQQARELIARLDRCAVQLQFLHIRLDSSLVLASPIVLPMLQELRISFVVQPQRPPDLSWLRAQPCMRLGIRVDMPPCSTAHQAQIVRQIQQLQVDHLFLEFLTPFSPAMQAIWQPLTTCQQIFITIRDPDSSRLELEALPSCQRLEIQAPAYAHREVLVHWAAVAGWDRHRGKNLYAADSSCTPYVLRYLGCPASGAAQPRCAVWADSKVQVVGTSASSVRLYNKHMKIHASHASQTWGWMLTFECSPDKLGQ